MRKIVLSLCSFALLALAACTDPTMGDDDMLPDAAPGQPDAAAMPDAAAPDAEEPDAEPPFMQVCGDLNQQCCYPDAALAGCNGDLVCVHGDGVPSFTCVVSTCTGDTPGSCGLGDACVYDVGSHSYTCASCGDAGESCCANDGCSLGNACVGGQCVNTLP
jgi:hypothetical protein